MNLKEIFAEFTIDVDEKYLFIYFLLYILPTQLNLISLLSPLNDNTNPTFLTLKINLLKQDIFGQTIIHYASRSGKVGLLKFLF